MAISETATILIGPPDCTTKDSAMMPRIQRPATSGLGVAARTARRCALLLPAIMCGLALALFSVSVFAQGVGTGPTVSSGLQAVENALQAAQGNLGSVGSDLFRYLAFLALVWWAGQLMLQGGDMRDTFGGLLRTVFLFGMAYWFMQPYADGQTPLVWFVGQLATKVTSVLMSNQDGSVAGTMATAFGSLTRMIAALMQVLTKPFSSTSGFLGGMEAIGVFFANLPMVLLVGLAIVLLWGAGITLFVMAAIGLIMFKVADIFAPLFIPFLVLPVVSWLFDGWLRFLLSAAMYKIAGAAIVLLGNAVLLKLVDMILGATMSWGATTVAAMVVAGLAFALLYVMLQLPSVAHGLISGHATVQMQKMMGHIGRGASFAAGATMAGAGVAGAAAGRGFQAVGGAMQARAVGAAATAAAPSTEAARFAMLGGMAASAAGDVTPVEPGRLQRLGRTALGGTGKLVSTAGRGMSGAGGAAGRAGVSFMRRGRRG